MGGVAFFLIRFVVEHVELRVDAAVLEVRRLKELNALRRQLPVRLAVLGVLLKLAIHLSVAGLRTGRGPNGKVGASYVVSCKRR